MNTDILQTLLPEINRIAIEAGEKIMDVYKNGFEVETKDDESPVTTADLAANRLIVSELSKLQPAYPILSEESAQLPFAERAARDTYWLVDPLDGTKEFINRRDSFTVNIALIHQHEPVLGVVFAPALNILYYAGNGIGSFKQSGNNKAQAIQVRKLPEQPKIAGSKSHAGPELTQFLDNVRQGLGEFELVSIGSSLKICMVAEGSADLYPRIGLTSEWDTAAAHCVVECAGGKLVKTDMSPLRYNTKDSLLNPYFFVIGNNDIDWIRYLPTAG